MGQERKLVTVLFADIVGSTGIVGRTDPEVVRETLDRAFSAVERVLTTHGATVEKFIGDAVMAVFGVPAAHDDDADRAVRAAFACHEAVAGSGRIPLELRIGVNSGEVVVGGPASARVLVTGEAVNLGSRLQQAAAAGEILVGSMTRELTARDVRYSDARTIDAKGIGPVQCWLAEALRSATPEPHRGLTGLRAPLIGRDREMSLLREAYERLAAQKRAYLVTVFGPAGSGKSRLTEEFVSSLGDARLLRGRCLPYGEAITFYPLQLILRSDAAIEPTDTHDEAVAKLRAAVHESFDDDADASTVLARVSVIAGLARADEALNDVPPDDVAEELRWGLRRYLERRARGMPLMLVFEDIHWAEPALLDIVENMVEWSRAPLFVLCLARPDLRDVRPAWGGGVTNAAAIDLAPLRPEDTRQLIAALLRIDALPESVRAEVVTRAEGNPLYVEEFLGMLMDSGRLERRGDRWMATSGIESLEVPPTLQSLIAARLDRVSPDVKHVLQRASLAGRLFSTATLAALADGQPPAMELLREAVRRDLLIEADERAVGLGRVFRFKHVLIRDVAYASLTKGERSRLHDRYGRWLEQNLGERRTEIEDIIAFHAEQAYLLAKELGERDADDLGARSFELLRSAARSAWDRGDELASRSLYERATRVADSLGLPRREQIEVRTFALLPAWRRERTPKIADSLEELLEEARAAGPSSALVHLLMWRAWRQRDRDVGLAADQREALAAEALAAARSTGDAELVAEATLLSAGLAPTTRETSAMLLGSVREQRRTGSRRTLADTLAELGRSMANLGAFTEGFAYREEALTLARASGSKPRICACLLNLVDGLTHVGDLARAGDLAEEALAIARENCPRAQIALALAILGKTREEGGDRVSAITYMLEALRDLERDGLVRGAGLLRISLARCLLASGELAEAEAMMPVTGDELLQVQLWRPHSILAVRGLIRAQRGEDVDAERLLNEALALATPTGIGHDIGVIRRDLARFLISRGRVRDAREHVDWLLTYYADPAAKRRYDEALELKRQCEALAT